ncbi:MAG: hypothetical protein Q9161_001723 [Pseudevernia consocians]
MYGGMAAAPLTAPEVMTAMATGEEAAISVEAGIGEGASLVENGAAEVGVKVGEGSTGSVGVEVSQEWMVVIAQELEVEVEKAHRDHQSTKVEMKMEKAHRHRQPLKVGVKKEKAYLGLDGTNKGPRSTAKGGKEVPRPKMPRVTKSSYDANGHAKTRGWHRVATGKRARTSCANRRNRKCRM